MLSGQHDLRHQLAAAGAPPRCPARVVNAASGLVFEWNSAAITTGRPLSAAISSRKGIVVVRPLVSM
jgi:hypothetical protein